MGTAEEAQIAKALREIAAHNKTLVTIFTTMNSNLVGLAKIIERALQDDTNVDKPTSESNSFDVGDIVQIDYPGSSDDEQLGQIVPVRDEEVAVMKELGMVCVRLTYSGREAAYKTSTLKMIRKLVR